MRNGALNAASGFELSLVLAVFLLSFFCHSASGATLTIPQFCVEGTHTYQTGCFSNLSEAEAFMRQNTPAYADVLKQVSSVLLTDGTTRLNYDVDDQPPSRFYEPVYLIGGNPDMTRQLCPGNIVSADPYFFPNYCLSEEPLLNNYVATYLQSNQNCTYSNIQVTGAYVAPFAAVHTDWPGTFGYLDNDAIDIAPRRKLEWDIYCTGWGTIPPDHRSVGLSKRQSFECRVDYRGRDIGGGPISYPNICEPTRWMPYILTTVQLPDLGKSNQCDVAIVPDHGINRLPSAPGKGELLNRSLTLTFLQTSSFPVVEALRAHQRADHNHPELHRMGQRVRPKSVSETLSERTASEHRRPKQCPVRMMSETLDDRDTFRVASDLSDPRKGTIAIYLSRRGGRS